MNRAFRLGSGNRCHCVSIERRKRRPKGFGAGNLETDMNKKIATAALAALLSAGTFATASAAPGAMAASTQRAAGTAVEQVDYRGHHNARRGHRHILSQREVIRSLYRRGYRDIRNMRLVRGDYVLQARGYRGQVRLVVDGRTGRIQSRALLRRHHNPGFTFRGGNGNFSYSFGIR